MMCPRGGRQHAHATIVYGRVQGAAGVGGAERAQDGGCRVPRDHLKPDLLTRWKAAFVTHAATVFAGDEASPQAERRIADLGRMVGRLTVGLEVARKLYCSQPGAAPAGSEAIAHGFA